MSSRGVRARALQARDLGLVHRIALFHRGLWGGRSRGFALGAAAHARRARRTHRDALTGPPVGELFPYAPLDRRRHLIDPEDLRDAPLERAVDDEGGVVVDGPGLVAVAVPLCPRKLLRRGAEAFTLSRASQSHPSLWNLEMFESAMMATAIASRAVVGVLPDLGFLRPAPFMRTAEDHEPFSIPAIAFTMKL